VACRCAHEEPIRIAAGELGCVADEGGDVLTDNSEDWVRADLADAGLAAIGQIHRNLPCAELVTRSLARREGILASNGAIVVRTGRRTGRSPNDRFIVNSRAVHDDIDWGAVNRPCSRRVFDHLLDKAGAFLQNRELFVFDGYAGADPTYREPIRVVSEAIWHGLFAHTLFLQPSSTELHKRFAPAITVIDCGALTASPKSDGVRSEAFVGIDLERRIVLIVGTMYAGEIKKSVFSVLNYLLPERGVLPMHCSANIGRAGDVALFFGLSGTGKTSLSADPGRHLIGDDEHGWGDDGVFNFEGGCYAKVIRISPRAEPQIVRAPRFGSILENVVLDPWTRAIDYDDDTITENTRATYPVSNMRGHVASGMGGHPRNVVFLTCDAYGVLPPIAKLTPEMASYHFLSGFTANLAGAETGVSEPVPTFSACFGAPFMPRPPAVYAGMLADRLERHGATCWLVNTGWSGGPYRAGHRMKIALTRRLVRAALSGALAAAEFRPDPVFKVLVPASCPGVPLKVLAPRATWADSSAYDAQAQMLARQFAENFEKYRAVVPPAVAAAGPLT
jgi:phosphoenolpyruvate carboxykinase (ATP)